MGTIQIATMEDLNRIGRADQSTFELVFIRFLVTCVAFFAVNFGINYLTLEPLREKLTNLAQISFLQRPLELIKSNINFGRRRMKRSWNSLDYKFEPLRY